MKIRKAFVLILYISILFTNNISAQNHRSLYFNNDSITYFSEEFYITNRENALFYQKKDTISNGNFYQYYLSGELFGKGKILNKLKDGEYITFYKDGKIKEKLGFEKNQYTGSYYSYFQNGALYQKGKFEEGNYIPIEVYDSTGNLIFNISGLYTNFYLDGQIRSQGNYANGVKTGIWKEYSKTWKIKESGKYTNGKKDSIWTGYWENGKLYYKEKYEDFLEKNQVKEGISYDSSGNSYEYTIIATEPIFLRGDMKETLKKELHYPKSLVKKGIRGKVYVELILEKDGSVSNIKVIKGLHPQLDQIALKATKQLDLWEPAKYRGQPVRLRKVQPITFSINK